MLQHQQLATGSQHSKRATSRSRGVGNRAEAERAGHRVEAAVLELERLGIADRQIRLMAKLLGAPA